MKSVVKVEATVKESLDEEIAELVSEVRSSQNVIEDHTARIHNAKERLAQLLTLRRSNWKDDVGYARIISEGTRISYDTSALDDLIIHEPLRYGWLKDYRQESPIAGRIMVK